MPTKHQLELANTRVDEAQHAAPGLDDPVVVAIATDYERENDRGRRAVLRALDTAAQEIPAGERRHGALDLIRAVRDTTVTRGPSGPIQTMESRADGTMWIFTWVPLEQRWLGRQL